MALLSLNRSLCCRYRLLFPHGYDVVCSHSGYSSDKVSLLLQDLSSLGFTCSINFETMCKSPSLQNSKKDPLSFLNSSTCSFPETRNIMLASENDIRFLFLKIIKTNALYQLNSHEKLCKRWDLKKLLGHCWERDTDFSWENAEDLFKISLFNKYLLIVHCTPSAIMLLQVPQI